MVDTPRATLLSNAEIRKLQIGVRQDERDLEWKKRRTRRFRTALILTVLIVPGLVAWSTAYSDHHRWLVSGNAVLGSVLAVSALYLFITSVDHLWKTDKLDWFWTHSGAIPDRYKCSVAELQDRLETDRASLRRASALAPVALHERRGLYREEVAEVIEHYQVESRKYRRVHNSLQSLVMVGSTTITTVAALDAKQWTWQTISVIVLGFCVTLASTFTGYYKYRERSYFLQQTADAIEEESNALSLGVGEYSLFSSDQEDQALAKFTQRVEVLRNEQRRRQQQLDQPAEHAAAQNPSGI
ncbi:DUF4231 domain-containing protein [Streptomyces sp. NBC_01224]|uniref:DUF4231 domain-containing protein n=1 Tax=Streptomyces sp. NBC_01224 TaxID=2903783 RepID=UPI002E13DD85|nr:DUF4231 domain-containing protein [Streptomyces sp. NBC_01224]